MLREMATILVVAMLMMSMAVSQNGAEAVHFRGGYGWLAFSMTEYRGVHADGNSVWQSAVDDGQFAQCAHVCWRPA